MGKKRISFVLALQTGQFNTALGMAQKKLGRVSRQMKKIGSSMTTNVTLPFVAIGAAGAKMAVEFDNNMTKIQTLVGVSADEVKNFKNEVMALSGKTAQAPAELAEGLFFLTSAGLEGANAMQTLEQVSKGVAIGLGEQADLAKVAAAAQNAYGEENMSASKALDIFGGMVQTGMFEASELAGVLGTQLGLASNLGISFEELGAMISTYTKTTGDANAATTGLSGIMMSFAKITPKQEEALASVGMTVEGLREKLGTQGLQSTLIEMQSAFQDNNVDLSEFFSKSQALKGVLGVLGNQTETYTEVLDKLETSTGFVNDGFETVSQGAGFKLQKSFNNLKMAGQQIGEALLPVIVKIANFVSKAVKAFMNLDSSTKGIIVGVGLLAAAIGPAITLLGTIGTVIAGITLPIIGVVSAILAIGAAFIYIRANWDATKERLGDFAFIKNSMLTLLQFIIENNPFSLLIEGYNKAVSYLGGTQIPNPFEGMAEGLEDLMEETDEYEHEFGTFGEALKSTANDAKSAILGMMGGGEFVSKAEETADATDEVTDAIEKVVKKTEEATPKLKTFFGKTAEDFQSMVESIADKAEQYSAVMGAMNTVSQAFTDRKLELLRRETDAELLQLEEQHAIQAARIENMNISEEEKNKMMLALTADFEDKKGDIEDKAGKKQRKLQRKAAKTQKAADLFGIVASTARSIASAVAASPLTGGMPWAGINAAIGAAQAAAILAAPLPALATGGLAYGPTAAMVGDNPGASVDPEVIAPLSKLQNMMGGNQVQVYGMIKGEDIVLASDRFNKRKNRIVG